MPRAAAVDSGFARRAIDDDEPQREQSRPVPVMSKSGRFSVDLVKSGSGRDLAASRRAADGGLPGVVHERLSRREDHESKRDDASNWVPPTDGALARFSIPVAAPAANKCGAKDGVQGAIHGRRSGRSVAGSAYSRGSVTASIFNPKPPAALVTAHVRNAGEPTTSAASNSDMNSRRVSESGAGPGVPRRRTAESSATSAFLSHRQGKPVRPLGRLGSVVLSLRGAAGGQRRPRSTVPRNLRLILTLGPATFIESVRVMCLADVEEAFIRSWCADEYRTFLRTRVEGLEGGRGRRKRPALLATWFPGRAAVPQCDVPGFDWSAGAHGVGGGRGEWRLVQCADELYEGAIVTPMHLAWRALLRNALERDVVRRRPSQRLRPEVQGRFWSRVGLQVHHLLNVPESSTLARIVSILILLLIAGSSVALVVETLPQFVAENLVTDLSGGTSGFFVFEAVCISFFTVEYLLRLLVAPMSYPGLKRPRALFVVQTMNVLDVVAIVPFYLERLISISSSSDDVPGLQVVRILRLVRVLRLMRASRGSALVLAQTARESARPIWILTFMLVLLVIISGTLAFFAERGTFDRSVEAWVAEVGQSCLALCPDDPRSWTWGMFAQAGCEDGGLVARAGGPTSPDGAAALEALAARALNAGPDSDAALDAARAAAGAPVGLVALFHAVRAGDPACVPILRQTAFASIPHALWWSVVTVTTVGYGDVVPITALGKLFGALTMVSALLVIALPVSVIGTRFVEIYQSAGGRQSAAVGNLDTFVLDDAMAEPDEAWLPRRPGSVGGSSAEGDPADRVDQRAMYRMRRY